MEPELNQYEVARVVGIRALDLENGAPTSLQLTDERLRTDMMYVAAREIYEGIINVRVLRTNGASVDPNVVGCCAALSIMLDTKDGKCRSVARSSTADNFNIRSTV